MNSNGNKPFTYHGQRFAVIDHLLVGTTHVKAIVQKMNDDGTVSGIKAEGKGGFYRPKDFSYDAALSAARENAAMNLIKVTGGNIV